MTKSVYTFGELPAELRGAAGGKGGTLAWLFQAGYPVPEGLVVLAGAFEAGRLAPGAWEEVRAGLQRLRGAEADLPLAVRSSALSEDSAQASFAGEFETMLDVRGDDAVRRAIEAVHASHAAERVQAYQSALGLGRDGGHPAPGMAVVVQRMARAELAGVLFTADPVSGSHSAMTGQFVRGLGDQLVSGEATGEAFTLSRPSGRYAGPPALRPWARRLYALADRLEDELGGPQDIEWAVARVGDRQQVVLLQARPITTLQGYSPATGEWNDSLRGDYLWTNTNYGEAIPDVMTPAAWSVLDYFMRELMPVRATGHHTLFGNVGGRFYMNVGAFYSMFRALGFKRDRLAYEMEALFGRVPPDMEIPVVPFARWRLLRRLLAFAVPVRRRNARNRKRMRAYLDQAPARAQALRQAVAAAANPAELADLWAGRLMPHLREAAHMHQAATSGFEDTERPLRHQLMKQVGAAEANALLSGLSQPGGEHLASLGPVLGLWQVMQGTLSREAYAEQWGHRSAHEFEVSMPRPAEDPAWIERQLAALREAPMDVAARLAEQQARSAAAWERYAQRFPRQAPGVRRRLDKAAAGARAREGARSEVVRALAAMRAFALRAGEMTGLGEDVFFLTYAEMVDVLRGDETALARIPIRRAAYERFRALPPYPTFIRGRFDPVRWAADPNRRADVYDPAARPAPPAEGALRGFPGAAGVVEGVARVLASVDEADQLHPGEVLVTSTTNIGWTPVFPRVAAVVTDVGAPLSHAAIVARELGIPAVVGTGNATTRLRTGDRVRVDGGRGYVERLAPAN